MLMAYRSNLTAALLFILFILPLRIASSHHISISHLLHLTNLDHGYISAAGPLMMDLAEFGMPDIPRSLHVYMYQSPPSPWLVCCQLTVFSLYASFCGLHLLNNLNAVGRNNVSTSSTTQQTHQIFCCAFNASGTVFVTGSSDTFARVYRNYFVGL